MENIIIIDDSSSDSSGSSYISVSSEPFVFVPADETKPWELDFLPYYQDFNIHTFNDEDETCVWNDPWMHDRQNRHPIM